MRKYIWTVFMSLVVVMGSSPVVWAQVATTGDNTSGWFKPIVALASGLTITLAAIGGAMSQSRAASTALEGIARNPQAAGQVQTPMIIALAMMEFMVILSFAIAFLLQNKI